MKHNQIHNKNKVTTEIHQIYARMSEKNAENTNTGWDICGNDVTTKMQRNLIYIRKRICGINASTLNAIITFRFYWI